MRLVIKCFFSILFMFNFLIAYAGAQNDLKAILTSIQSLQGTFNQTVYTPQGQAKKHYTGEMALSRPNHFYWKIKTPIQQISIADGKQLWVYDPALKQANVQSLKKGKIMTPAAILSGSDKGILNDFYISNFQGWFILKPKLQSMIKKVSLKFKGNKLQEMQILDELGQTTTIQFSNIQVNRPIKTSLFHFNIPKGIDISYVG